LKLSIDNRVFDFNSGETILGVALRNGIKIPTLCFDQRFPHSTSCFVCIVKDENSGKLIPSCSVKAADGMKITTSNEEILKYRKLALELLLSEHDADCFSPCKTACPAGIDIRDYLLYSRTGQELEGFLKIRDKNPLVASVGRVCPAFCEEDCSRNNIDETLNIRLLKRYLGDVVYAEKYDELLKKEKALISRVTIKKNIAIIGGGPSGLSAAYYLVMTGHNVAIYDENKELGGMLRYSIPPYRLPREILDKEIDSIVRLGVKVKTDTKIDANTVEELKKKYDHVISASGTWKESTLGMGEEKVANVMPALRFLKDVWTDKIKTLGKNVVVIGGGNSAIDAARTALRLGAKDVKIVYRRTRTQMPATKVEIEDAINEGVKLFELYSPASIVDGKITFNVMELSPELDASGRNKIKDTGKTSQMDFDFLTYAVGQKPNMDAKLFEKTCGDANLGASTVIEAVADGRKAAFELMDNEDSELIFYSSRKKNVLPYNVYKKILAQKPKHLDVKKRIKDFAEVEIGYKTKIAVTESNRCINCGCAAIDDCELRKNSIEYAADPLRFKQKDDTGVSTTYQDLSTDFFIHEPGKCIKCGRCINVCDHIAGSSALSFIGRGLNVSVSSNTNNNIKDSTCMLCGMCIDSCPTGALVEKNDDAVWHYEKDKVTECDWCILKCKLDARRRSVDTPICSVGRWNGYYSKQITNKNDIKIDPKKLAAPTKLTDFDCVVSVDYDPKGDNPRVLYEFNKMRAAGIPVHVCSAQDAEELLDKNNNTLLVVNYFTLNSKDLKLVERAKKVLPVYYR
jgi:formate dehydrogenase major subunit